MKELLFGLAVAIVFMSGLLSINVKKAEAGLCEFVNKDGGCCESGVECYLL